MGILIICIVIMVIGANGLFVDRLFYEKIKIDLEEVSINILLVGFVFFCIAIIFIPVGLLVSKKPIIKHEIISKEIQNVKESTLTAEEKRFYRELIFNQNKSVDMEKRCNGNFMLNIYTSNKVEDLQELKAWW